MHGSKVEGGALGEGAGVVTEGHTGAAAGLAR